MVGFIVVHLLGDWTPLSDPYWDFDANALGSFNVLEATRRHVPHAVLINASTNIAWAFTGYAPSPFDYYVTNVSGQQRDVGAGEFV